MRRAAEQLLQLTALLLAACPSVLAIYPSAAHVSGRFEFRDVSTQVLQCPSAAECGDAAVSAIVSRQTQWQLTDNTDFVGGRDLIVSLVSSVHVPGVVHCYSEDDAGYALSVDWDRFVAGAAGSVTTGRPLFCFGVVVTEAVEYIDAVDDGEAFDPDADEAVRVIDFRQQKDDEILAGYTTRAVYVSSVAGDTEMTWSCAPTAARQVTGTLMTPNATLFDLNMQFTPSRPGESRLALVAHLVVANAQVETELVQGERETVVRVVPQAGLPHGGYVRWPNKLPVRVGQQQTGGAVDLPGIAAGVLGESIAATPLYFTFAADVTALADPVKVHWEATLGAGAAPLDDHASDVSWTMFVVGSLVAPAALVGGAMWLRIRAGVLV